MSGGFNPDRKKLAFLSQFLTETLYQVPEKTEKAFNSTTHEKSGQATEGREDQYSADKLSKPTDQTVKEETPDYGIQEEAPHDDESVPEAGKAEEATTSDPSKEKVSEDAHAEASAQQELSVSSASTATERAINYYGNFQKRILILVNYFNQKDLIPKDRLVLGQILKAIGLSFEDVAVINVQKAQMSWESLQKAFGFSKVMAFGVDKAFFPVTIQYNEIARTENDLPVMLAPSIEEIASDKKLKKQLWQNLKTLFKE